MSNYRNKQNKPKAKHVTHAKPVQTTSHGSTTQAAPGLPTAPAQTPAGLTLDQHRAKHALAQVQTVTGDGWRSDYRSYVRGMPLTLRLNGLGQFIALQMAQSSGTKGAAHQAALAHILQWLGDSWASSPYNIGETKPNDSIAHGQTFLSKLTGQNEADMLRAQRELMAYLKWLKTFAEALLPAKEAEPVETAGDAENAAAS